MVMNLPRAGLILLFAAAPISALHPQTPQLDSLDAFVKEQMARRHIPGLSLAIIQQGRIVVAKGYGVTDETTRTPVTSSTLFLAGSISKPVSALGALHLIEAGRLSLDEDVNVKLSSWKVPENTFTRTDKVTLRRLLSHSAGLTVHGFPGYDVADSIPTLVQVLNGTRPANTEPIRVDTTPGAIWRYSGGGFTIMQQLIIDVTGTPFPRFMQETVLGPIGMTTSSFDQPQPPGRAAITAAGYYGDRTPVRGRWHLYPEMAAAGLWTTPTDLARFAIEIQETLAGKGHGVISPAMARQFVTEQKGGSGLGIAVQGTGASLQFSHGGRDEGFDASLEAFAATGQGVAIMINANDNSRFMGTITQYIARLYHWPVSWTTADAPVVAHGVRLPAERLTQFAGYYERAENQMITLVPNQAGTGLATLTDGLPDEEFLAVDSLHFGSSERNFRFEVVVDAGGAATGIRWRRGTEPERLAPRVAPLPSSRQPASDPDPGMTTRITAALRAMEQGGTALANAPDIAPGTRKDFARGLGSTFDGMGTLTYVGQEDVSSRGIHRHGGDVARVLYYRVNLKAGERYLLVHLTSEGSVTDYDLGER